MTAGRGTRLLAPYTLGLMRTPQVPVPGVPSLAMGLSWMVQDLPGLQLVMHGGDTFGQHTVFMFAPGRGFALVLLTNHEPGGVFAEGAVTNEAAQQYLGFGLEAARVGFVGAMKMPAGIPTLGVLSDLTQYVGRYTAPDITYVLRRGNGGLLLTIEQTIGPEQIMSSIVPKPVRDTPVSFIAADLALLEQNVLPFVRKPNGEVGWIAVGLRLVPRTGLAQ